MFAELNSIGTHECRRWSGKIFRRHWSVDKILKHRYIRQARSYGYKKANCDLREINEALSFGGTFSATMDDQAICDYAVTAAESCESIFHELATYADVSLLKATLEHYCRKYGVDFPLSISKKDDDAAIAEKVILAAKRVSDERWWRRQVRKVTGRKTEGLLRSIGCTRKEKAPYVSNWTFARWKASMARNKKTVASMEATTTGDLGEEIKVDLSDCITNSVSNPENMRNELMVRMRGYEEIAIGLEFVGLFFTITTPSRFHAQYEKGGINKKFDGSTPRDAMDHLNKMWSLIRAEWARQGIKSFGFRVAEPHHDGTPHFHLLLFFHPDDQHRATEIFGRYALSVDGDEPGADKQRWDVKAMDPGKGCAAGYIAKYVAKNLDGYAVGVDEEGQCLASEGAMRARAWSSVWGIRQFQQIGSVSVTVWRELRRRREIFDEMTPEEVEPLRAAADKGDWAEFVKLMGGALVCRKDMTLRPAYIESSTVTSKYGEPVTRLIGVWLKPVGKAIGRCTISTRDNVWQIKKKDGCVFGQVRAAGPPIWECQQAA